MGMMGGGEGAGWDGMGWRGGMVREVFGRELEGKKRGLRVRCDARAWWWLDAIMVMMMDWREGE